MIYVILFMIGACIGSFVNVILSRNDWYKGRSRCDSCGYVLKWYDLIPIFSYLMFSCKCRKCKKHIDSSHFMSELFMGAAFVVGYICYLEFSLEYSILSALSLFFIAIYAIEDTKEQMIYSSLLNAGIILTGIIKVYILYNTKSYFDIFILIVTVILFKVMTHIISFAGIGNGDFDIILVMYMLFGDYGCGFSIAVSSFVGCAIYIPAVILKKYDRKQPLALAPLLFMGTMICLLM